MPAERIHDTLATLIAARGAVRPGSTWKHYKGGIYEVVDLAIDTVDGSVRVTYQRIEGPDYHPLSEPGIFYSRPLSEWFDKISVQQGDGSIPDDVEPRFKEVFKTAVYQ